jgi:hypothetical protein
VSGEAFSRKNGENDWSWFPGDYAKKAALTAALLLITGKAAGGSTTGGAPGLAEAPDELRFEHGRGHDVQEHNTRVPQDLQELHGVLM